MTTYIAPYKRKMNPPSIPMSPTLTCAWCHQVGHLSINCIFKGEVQEKKPDLFSSLSFPSLSDSPIADYNNSIWDNTNSIYSDETIHSPLETKESLNKKTLSTTSLDTTTSLEFDNDEINNIIYKNNNFIKKENPYKEYYDDIHTLYTNDFLKDYMLNNTT